MLTVASQRIERLSPSPSDKSRTSTQRREQERGRPRRSIGIEHDLLGDREVPAGAYYGVHTLRAVENFPITGTPISIYPDLIEALACIKQAAALANHELGLLERGAADAIVEGVRGDSRAAACTTSSSST